MAGTGIKRMVMRAASRGAGMRGAGIRQIEHRVYIEYLRRNGDPTKGDAAYYPVRDGFSSAVVKRIVAELADRGHLIRKGSLYAPGDGATILIGVIEGSNDNLKDADMMREMFYGHPLSEFMIAYKLGFMPEFRRYCNRLARTGTEGDPRRLLDSFVEALLVVPDEDEFREFRLLFKDFSRAFHVLLGNDPDHDGRMPDRLDLAIRAHGKIWDAFVAVARLYHHNPDYKGLVREWEIDRDDAMAELEIATSRFLDSVSDLDGPSRMMSNKEREELLKAVKRNDLTRPIPARKELEFAKTL